MTALEVDDPEKTQASHKRHDARDTRQRYDRQDSLDLYDHHGTSMPELRRLGVR